MAKPDKFYGKLFEARCVAMLHHAGIHITQFEPQYQSDNRPDLEVEVEGQRVTVECTSLRHSPATHSTFEEAIEQDEAFRLAFREIKRPYHVMLNVLPNLQDPLVVEKFLEVFIKWFGSHADREEEVLQVVPGFEGLNRMLTPGLPAARIVYSPDASYVRVGGKTAIGIIPGSPKGLKNALEHKKDQVRGNRTGMNIITIDMAFRTDLSLQEMAPAILTNQPPESMTKFFTHDTTRHVSGVHLSTMNIFSNKPSGPARGWINPNAAIRRDNIVNVIFVALSE